MLKPILTTYSTLLASLLFAQSVDSFKVSGIVVSQNSGEVIPFGTIMISRNTGYQCDSLGCFILYHLAAGRHTVTFSAAGFSTIDTTFVIDKDVSDFKLSVYTDCLSFPHFNETKAQKDITEGKPRLLLFGGIAPVFYTNQKVFERKYKVTYYDFGCTPDLNECILAYNRIVFAYLDKKYGEKWRKEVRKDVIGLNDK